MLKNMEVSQTRTASQQPQAVFDGLVTAFSYEVERYEATIRRLFATVEAPRPKNEPCEEKECMPETLQDATRVLINRMAISNGNLHDIITRLQEQVGELKILP